MTENNMLEIFSDYIWPWCYFITGSIERLQKEFGIDIRWAAFPLHPDTPEEGKTLEELFKDRDVDIDQVMAHLKQVASVLGLPFGDRKMTYNSRLAQELGKYGQNRETRATNSIMQYLDPISWMGKILVKPMCS